MARRNVDCYKTSDFENDAVYRDYYDKMNSDKKYDDDGLMDFARKLLNGHPFTMYEEDQYFNYGQCDKIFLDMAKRGIIFTRIMMNKILNTTKPRKGIEILPWLKIMRANGMKTTKSDENKLCILKYYVPFTYIKENGYECSQKIFDQMALDINITNLPFKEIKKIITKNSLEITDIFMANLCESYMTDNIEKLEKFCVLYLKFIRELDSDKYELMPNYVSNFLKTYCNIGWKCGFLETRLAEKCPTGIKVLEYFINNSKHFKLDICFISKNYNIIHNILIHYLLVSELVDKNIDGNEQYFAQMKYNHLCSELTFQNMFEYFKSTMNNTLYQQACWMNFSFLLDFILNKNSKIILINEENFDYACKSGNVKLVEFFLSKKVKVLEKHIINFACSLYIRVTDLEIFEKTLNKMFILCNPSVETKYIIRNIFEIKIIPEDDDLKFYCNAVKKSSTKQNSRRRTKNDKKICQEGFEKSFAFSELEDLIKKMEKNENLEINVDCVSYSMMNDFSICIELINYISDFYNIKPSLKQILACPNIDLRFYLYKKYCEI